MWKWTSKLFSNIQSLYRRSLIQSLSPKTFQRLRWGPRPQHPTWRQQAGAQDCRWWVWTPPGGLRSWPWGQLLQTGPWDRGPSLLTGLSTAWCDKRNFLAPTESLCAGRWQGKENTKARKNKTENRVCTRKETTVHIVWCCEHVCMWRVGH